jgi:hypothetical protein
VFLCPVWSGDLSSSAGILEKLDKLGTPLLSQVTATSYAELLAVFDARMVSGRHYAARTRTLPALTPGAIAALIDAGNSLSSPLSTVFVHHFHGAATRVPVETTAFGLRQRHLVVEIVAAWEPGQDGAAHQKWAAFVAEALAAGALPGGYAGILGPDDHDQIAHAYGPNAGRLRDLKRRYDPERVFTAIPLPPDPQPETAADTISGKDGGM